MKYIIKPKAQHDIREAMEWYKEQSENLPEKLLSKIDESLEKIEKNPEIFQKRYKRIRIVFTKKFPYRIYFNIIYTVSRKDVTVLQKYNVRLLLFYLLFL